MAELVDYLGRPIEKKALTQELAAPSLAGVRQVFFDSIASGLTPERLGQILASVDQGDPYDYLTLAEEMEERDLHYYSVLSTRKHAVMGLEMMVEAASDDKRDVEVSDAVRELLTSDAARAMLPTPLDALGKSYSVSEIMWDSSEKQWWPERYEERDQRYFVFDRETQSQLRLRDAQNMSEGIELAPYKFIQHRPKLKSGLTIRSGLARLAVIAFMCKNYALKDWLAFAEVFGMPLRLGKYPSAANADQKAKLLAAVTNIGTDAAAIVPDSMVIEFVEAAAAAGGDKLFMGLADWLDRQVSKGVLGQVATTEGTPGKLGNEDAQENVREDIMESDALQLAATLRRDLVKPFVDLNYGPPKKLSSGRDGYPKISIREEDVEDLSMLATALPPFIDRGLPVEVTVILDKFNLKTPKNIPEGALLGAKPPPVAPGAPQPDGKQPPPKVPAPPDEEDEKKVALQREVSTRLKALLAARQPDELDRLADDAAKDWRQVIDPILQPIIELAERAGSREEFEEQVAALQLDASELMKVVQLLTFKARGVGDAEDESRGLTRDASRPSLFHPGHDDQSIHNPHGSGAGVDRDLHREHRSSGGSPASSPAVKALAKQFKGYKVSDNEYEFESAGRAAAFVEALNDELGEPASYNHRVVALEPK